MAELRRDPIVERWVIIDTDHPSGPEDFEKEPLAFRGGDCPFCYGNESTTPPEIEVIRDPATESNKPGWLVRVMANKFPALQIEGDIERRGLGLYDISNGIGAHEIIVQTPYHHKELSDLEDYEVENVIKMYCRRMTDLHKDTRFKYILLFKNYGPSSGASLEHPHTQLIALPMIPKNVQEELDGAFKYFDYRERCIFCDINRQELQEKERIVFESKYFLAFCPYVSRFPFEVWIIPKKHQDAFCQMAHEQIPELAKMLKSTLSRISDVLLHPAYNFIIHTSPINTEYRQGYHWHIEIMPKLTRVAGFEWGTGFYIVPTPPELAAKYLRGEKI
ncbi:MAG: galactose-1-phosphate uridylyltransferase [Omnitrophica WOR_2 bacterium RIFCSPHIGHO2_02_FULL_45_21]|nr:MAG: galactose-1-phosphate uridylyltransferase [Omnitrophica WOR_2 bacterium RIFCSPHIGHO2_02_FULL_45_21]